MELNTGRLIAMERYSKYYYDRYWANLVIYIGISVGILVIFLHIFFSVFDIGYTLVLEILLFSSLYCLYYMLKSRTRLIIYENGFVPNKMKRGKSGQRKKIFLKWNEVQRIKVRNIFWKKKKWLYLIYFKEKNNPYGIYYKDYLPNDRKKILAFLKIIEKSVPKQGTSH